MQPVQGTFVGIDVSKGTLDVYVLPQGKSKTFPNTGLTELIAWMKRLQPTWIVLEPTGGYELPVATALLQAGFSVSRPHPFRMHHHAKGLGHHAKTDRLDAKALAHFGQCYAEELLLLEIDPVQNELRQLVQRRRQLVTQRTQEKNRLDHEELVDSVKAGHERLLAFLERELKEIEDTLAGLIAGQPQLQEKCRLLESVQGIGRTISQGLVALLPELGTINRKQLAALTGLAPRIRQSGKYRGQASTGGGRSEIRSILYMGTLVAIKHCKPIRAYYEKLVNRGKAKKVAIVACMHKLLRILNNLLLKREPFNPNVSFA